MEKNYKTKKEEMKNEKTAGNAVVFENPEFGKIRTLTDENGEPLFCAKDVCDVLGYKRANDAVYQLVKVFDTAFRRSKLSGRLRKDGTQSERFQHSLPDAERRTGKPVYQSARLTAGAGGTAELLL